MQDQFDFYEDEQEGNVFQNLTKYLFYWKWFLICVLLALSATYLRIRYISPEYKAVSKILVRDEKKGSISSELGAFSDMGLLSGMKNNVDNEIEILNSITLAEKAVKRLKFTTTYFRLGNIRDVEAYKTTQPFEFVIENASEVFYKSPQSYTIAIISEHKFKLMNSEGIAMGTFNFGTTIALKEAKIKIQKLPSFDAIGPIDSKYTVYAEPLKKIGEQYNKVLTVEALSKTSSIVNMSITNKVPEKAVDFLNTLVAIYNEEAIKDKNMISENTQDFVQKRLEIISNELGTVEVQSENFKKTNKLTDINTDAKIYLETNSNFENSLIETETQLRVLAIMIDFMKNKGKTELIPIDIIPKTYGSAQANPLIVEYNQLVLQRNRILKDGTQKNYVLLNLDQQLEELERNIKESLGQLKLSLMVKRSDLEKQAAILQGKITSIPTQEREFRILDRQQKIKEGIYLYLIQKREETAITLSVKETNAKVIDAGRAIEDPISPKKNVLYLIALLAGIGIPFLVLNILFQFDNKIKNANDVESISKNISIVSELPNALDTKEALLQKKEAFRTLLNNTNFISPNEENKGGKIIFVTSSIKGEGKTFVSFNLATAYADLNKKTILIGADCRNPQVHKYLNQNRKVNKGLTSYLHDYDQNWQDLICKTEEDIINLDVLVAGEIPPNPTLLLSNPRFDTLMTELKKVYDIILVDTAPTLLVSDTLIISKYADITLYVVRAGVTEKKLINYCLKLSEDKKIINMGMVINGVDFSRSHSYGYGYNYGYGYGYGVDEIKKPWYKKSILGKLFSNES